MHHSVFISGFVFLLAIGGIGLFLLGPPEQSMLMSEDGALTISGLTRASQPFTIDERDQKEPFLSPVYVIGPEGFDLETPATIELSSVQVDEGVYRYDDRIDMWRLESIESPFETNRLGQFVQAPLYEVDTPNFVLLRDALSDLAPEQAKGYTISVGAAIQGASFYLDDMDEVGGCAGVFSEGSSTEFSRLEQKANVPVNGMHQVVTFIYIAEWQIDSFEGCGEADLLPANTVIE